jgi:hypothetical protein
MTLYRSLKYMHAPQLQVYKETTIANHMLYESGSFCRRINFFCLFHNFALLQRWLFKTISFFAFIRGNEGLAAYD